MTLLYLKKKFYNRLKLRKKVKDYSITVSRKKIVVLNLYWDIYISNIRYIMYNYIYMYVY